MRKPQHRLIRNRHFKLMFEPKGRRFSTPGKDPYSLFAVDPKGGEERDLLSPAHAGPETERVFSKLSSALEGAVPLVEAREVETVPLDEKTQERLEALGYLE